MVNVTDGKTADNKGAYDIPLLANNVIVVDRYYNDFSLLKVWDSNSVYFFNDIMEFCCKSRVFFGINQFEHNDFAL